MNEVTATPPMLTLVAAPIFVPVTVTKLPTVALAGVNVIAPGTTSAVVTVKDGETNGVPVAALIVNVEVKALANNGIFTRIRPLERTTNGTATDPEVNLTEVVPARLVPDMTSAVPAPPEVTLNGLVASVGVAAVVVYVNVVGLVRTVEPVVTVRAPVEPPAGTTTIIEVGEIYVTDVASTPPPNLMTDEGVNALPVTVTAVPGPLVAGEKLVISALTVSEAELLTRAPKLVTEMTPDCAVAGRVAVI